MLVIDVRIVYPPPEDARPAYIDGEALGRKAVDRNAWQYLSTHGGGARVVAPTTPRRFGEYQPASSLHIAPVPSHTTCCAAIAAPSGQVAVWYGEMSAVFGDFSAAAFVAFSRASDSSEQIALARRATQAWGSTLRGNAPRKVIARAACRLLHAQVFAYEAAERDRLLVELWELDPARVLDASMDTLHACSALVMLGDERGARALLLGQPALAGPAPIERLRS